MSGAKIIYIKEIQVNNSIPPRFFPGVTNLAFGRTD